jgi:hypothetical protein
MQNWSPAWPTLFSHPLESRHSPRRTSFTCPRLINWCAPSSTSSLYNRHLTSSISTPRLHIFDHKGGRIVRCPPDKHFYVRWAWDLPYVTPTIISTSVQITFFFWGDLCSDYLGLGMQAKKNRSEVLCRCTSTGKFDPGTAQWGSRVSKPKVSRPGRALILL